MMYKVNKGTVKYKRAFHAKGSLLDAQEQEIHQLLKAGILSKSEAIPQGQVQPSLQQSTAIASDPSSVPPSTGSESEEELPTVGAFAKLRADEQREILESLEIEPGINGDERTEQYRTRYEQQGGEEETVIPGFNADDLIVEE